MPTTVPRGCCLTGTRVFRAGQRSTRPGNSGETRKPHTPPAQPPTRRRTQAGHGPDRPADLGETPVPEVRTDPRRLTSGSATVSPLHADRGTRTAGGNSAANRGWDDLPTACATGRAQASPAAAHRQPGDRHGLPTIAPPAEDKPAQRPPDRRSEDRLARTTNQPARPSAREPAAANLGTGTAYQPLGRRLRTSPSGVSPTAVPGTGSARTSRLGRQRGNRPLGHQLTTNLSSGGPAVEPSTGSARTSQLGRRRGSRPRPGDTGLRPSPVSTRFAARWPP